MEEFVSKIKQKYQDCHQNDTNKTFVSSNVPIERSKKHNGCTGWRQNKKGKKSNHDITSFFDNKSSNMEHDTYIMINTTKMLQLEKNKS